MNDGQRWLAQDPPVGAPPGGASIGPTQLAHDYRLYLLAMYSSTHALVLRH